MTRLNELEQAVLRAGLTGSGIVLETLLNRASLLQVSGREYTGVGFFTTVKEVADDLKVGVNNFEVSDIDGAASALNNGFGCVLFIRNGQIASIECFTYDEPWPVALGSFEVSTGKAGERNYDEFLN